MTELAILTVILPQPTFGALNPCMSESPVTNFPPGASSFSPFRIRRILISTSPCELVGLMMAFFAARRDLRSVRPAVIAFQCEQYTTREIRLTNNMIGVVAPLTLSCCMFQLSRLNPLTIALCLGRLSCSIFVQVRASLSPFKPTTFRA